ncbi:MAG: PorT family protein [Muribaculaceae bacterium]|nr:PorT family protein [Muribaculaceae bacterium]
MKRYISIFTILAAISFSCYAEEPHDDGGCRNWNNFVHNIECYGRIGYVVGGTAPLGIPETIRGLNEFILQPNVSFGADAIKPINDHWGVLAGIHFENKGMHIDATVKNYHMKFTQGGQTLEGMFTGNNDSKAVQWMFTVPIQGVYKFSDKWKLKFGPYFSYLTDKRFDGFAYDGYLREGDPTGAKVYLGSEDEERGNYDFRDDIRSLQWGLDLGVDYFFARRFGIYADLAWGMSGFFKSSFHTLDQTLYPIYGIVGITYKFR